MDFITDFESVAAHIQLGWVLYKALHTGQWNNIELVYGKNAETTSRHRIFDRAAGSLWYDADGSASSGEAGTQTSLVAVLLVCSPPMAVGGNTPVQACPNFRRGRVFESSQLA